MKVTGCAPAEALFVGDSPDHDIVGARRAGMRSALITDGINFGAPRSDTQPDHVIHTIPAVLGLIGDP